MLAEESNDTSEIEVRDLTQFVRRQNTNIACFVVCDPSQMSIFSDFAENAAKQDKILQEHLRRASFMQRHPKADKTIVDAFFDKSPQPFDRIDKVPMNLLTVGEIERLGIRKCELSDHVLLGDEGASVMRLYWAIVAPHAGLADAVNTTPTQQLRLLKRVIGIRDDQERERLAEVLKQWGLPAFRLQAKTQDIRECLAYIGALTR